MTRCFVIGPIGNKFAPPGSSGREHYEDALQVFEYVILPACKKYGIDPVRADGIAKSGEITDQIFRHLAEDEVVVADVSGGNPNVMYELGLRHTTGLLTLQIGEYGQLPFDVSAVRTIQFSRSERGLIDARKALEEALDVGLAEGGDPVTATKAFGGRQLAAVDAAPERDAQVEASEEAYDADTDLDAEGFVEQMSALEAVFPNMTERVETIGTVLEHLGADAQDMGGQFDLLNAGGAPMTARLAAIKSFSERLQPHADALTETTTAFADDMSKIDSSVRGVLEYVEENDAALSNNDVEEFLDGLIAMAGSSREGMEGLNTFSGIVRGLGKISKTLRRPGKQMGAALDAMASAVAVMDDWEAKALRLRRKDAVTAPAGPSGSNDA